ncbi:putative cytochrome c oxidase subunit III [Sphingomonas changbaiensis NBRC 104936]|uniref:Putative cytochrome c oxidase subunit III n=1 Tax=Sphingomonas changbaiensis NBRC 104936 TaxID=1219043 RepID=A0A0E9MMT0_9SPHN|nr:cytochrome c oxidase subunit 3 [Sphingomonas changbaiensis]GAO38849.1 putative cytochrome c oxidase subunit III [Sphingomonas changbaiensis NBRC 104936]
MSAPYRFTRDLAELPTHAFGNRSLTWWGVILFMLMEGSGFALAGAAYFILKSHQGTWPPAPLQPPGLLAGTLFTLLILASEIPNTIVKKKAEAEEIAPVRLLLPIMAAIGGLLLVIRAFEFDSLNVMWTDNPYGSIVWALLVLHTTHILTDWFDTVVLTVLMFTQHGPTGKRFVDVSENSLYWRFVWLAWLPIYLLIYWVPRW